MRAGDSVADRFDVERLAGTGGMGEVYLARDRQGGAPVALKVLRADPSDSVTDLGGERDRTGDTSLDERFAREAQVLADLRHPGIVRYVAHGTTGAGNLFLAMEWLDGEDLSTRLSRSGLTVDETLTLIGHVADALAIVHARGVVHRDIKPSNVFLVDGDVERPKLLDFGIARLGGGTRAATSSGMLMGTPGYMSPEQARGDRAIDVRADIFALGCVAFECLTGKPLFVGSHPLAVLAKIVFEEVPRVRTLRPELPAHVDELLARMLAKDPDRRPGDAGVLADMIRDLGAVSGSTPAPLRESLRSLGDGEQRLFSVIVAQPRGRSAIVDAVAPTMADGGTLRTPRSIVDLEMLRGSVRSFGGRLELLHDGSFVVTLGARGAATDQAANAARCALALRTFLPDARMALATGRGVVADRWAVGEVIDRVAMLVRETEGSTGVRIDDVTAGLLDTRFEIGGAQALELRAERSQVDSTRTLLGRPSPCVGRDRELGMLEGIFAECLSEPTAHAVFVTGPAGVGKSRLRYELVRRLAARNEAVGVWIARGDPMSAGSPFGMVGKAIRAIVGIVDGEPLEVRRQKLRARVGRNVDAANRDRVAEFVGELASVPFDDAQSPQLRAAREEAVLLGDQMRRAFEDLLAAECAQSPVLLVLDNLQWGDLPTMKLVDGALRSLHDRPLMVLALARPEVRSLFPDAWAGRAVTEIHLGELSRKASEKLVRHVLEGAAARVDDPTVERIVTQAAGNALYLEELIRAFAARSPTDETPEALPATVLAMVQARLERLEPEARRVLRAASIFGDAFWRGAAMALLGGAERTPGTQPRSRGINSIDEWIELLVEREVIVPRKTARFLGEDELVFRSPLVREAAYAMLTDADRILGHKLAAQWLEDAGEADAVVLAEHWERGGEPSRAIEWYRRGAEQALGGNDLQAVIARADRGIACGAADERLGALRMLQAEAHKWRGEFARAEVCGTEAMALLPAQTSTWYAALCEVVAAVDRQGKNDRLIELAERLRTPPSDTNHRGAHAVASVRVAIHLTGAGRYELSDELLAFLDRYSPDGPDGTEDAHAPSVLLLRARVHQARAMRALFNGSPAGCREHSAAAAEAFDRAGDVRRATNHRLAASYASLQLGDHEGAEAGLREGLAAAERAGLAGLAATAKHNLGLALLRRGAVDEARAVEADAVARFRAQGDRRMEGASRMYLAKILSALGDHAGAEDEGTAAVEMLQIAPPLQALAHATLADVRLARGANAEALDTAQKGIDLLASLGKMDEGEALLRLVHAESLSATGDAVGARRAIVEAHTLLLERAEQMGGDEVARARFIAAVPEHARTLERMRTWGD